MILGIDPGKNGGLAWLTDEGRVDACSVIPKTERDLWDLLRWQGDESPLFAYLEKVSSRPGQGVVSVFTFGRGYGQLEMALTGRNIPFDRVLPNTWQKALGCLSGGDKNVTKQRAQELFPATKITHAVADALLIAEYGRRLRVKEGK